LPSVTIKAKDLANEITGFNVKKDQTLQGETPITFEHVKNNEGVRKLLNDRGIEPEQLPAAEDVRKVKRKVAANGRKILKSVKRLK